MNKFISKQILKKVLPAPAAAVTSAIFYWALCPLVPADVAGGISLCFLALCFLVIYLIVNEQ